MEANEWMNWNHAIRKLQMTASLVNAWAEVKQRTQHLRGSAAPCRGLSSTLQAPLPQPVLLGWGLDGRWLTWPWLQSTSSRIDSTYFNSTEPQPLVPWEENLVLDLKTVNYYLSFQWKNFISPGEILKFMFNNKRLYKFSNQMFVVKTHESNKISNFISFWCSRKIWPQI